MIAFQRGWFPVEQHPFLTMKHAAPYCATGRYKLGHPWILPDRIYSRTAILDALFPSDGTRQLHQRLVAGLDAVQAELLVV